MIILVCLGLGFSFIKDGSSMFNPGNLTAQSSTGLVLGGFVSHSEFEKECKKCHDPLQNIQADLCVRCHTTILKQVVDQTGTHAKIKNLQECRVCHPDHRGRDFDPTTAAFDRYDHDLANFKLTWHQVDYDATPMECIDCHARENGFYIKTESCQSCHTSNDPEFMVQHIRSLGDDCLACHDGSGDISNFDHAVTQFPLEGAHTQLMCVDCHMEARFDKLPTDCLSCHGEPEIHAGLFSTNCETCHTTNAWAALVGMDGQLFDHFEQTGFSMARHMTNYENQLITCMDCHISADGINVAFELRFCVDCHTDHDSIYMVSHQTQYGLECLACHDGIDRMHDFDHARVFILDGAHTDIDCAACHINQVFSGTPSECMACHIEPEIHAGDFGLQCENCHNSTAWSPAQMAAHNFPLDHGEQGLVSCETCHEERYTAYTCYGCHEHQPGEIMSEHLEEGISQVELVDCVACHPDGREHDD